jgi:hypothetical protein
MHNTAAAGHICLICYILCIIQQQLALPLHVASGVHTSAYVSIRRAYVSMRRAYLSIPQHTSAYLSIRQHTPAYISIPQHTSAYLSIRGCLSPAAYAYIIGAMNEEDIKFCVCVCVCMCVCVIAYDITAAGRSQRGAARGGGGPARVHSRTDSHGAAQCSCGWSRGASGISAGMLRAYVSIRQHTSAYVAGVEEQVASAQAC